MKPEFFIIGAPKCGTTSLASYLSEHPGIRFSIPKEPHFFCHDLNVQGVTATTYEDYLVECFSNSQGDRMWGEGSVWYLYSEVAVREITALNPWAKFIVLVRNPADMAWSLFCQFTYMGWDSSTTIEAAWDEDVTSRKTGLCPEPKVLKYPDTCALGTQLRKLYEWAVPDSVLVLTLEDLSQRPKETYESVLRFLSVPDDGRENFPIIGGARKLNHRWAVNVLRSRVARSTAAVLRKALNTSSLGFGRPDWKVPSHTKLWLAEALREETEIVEDIVGKHLRA